MLSLPVPYDPDWPNRFLGYRAEIIDKLAETNHHIQHIGSTAVPGMHAKPIIDIQIAVSALDAFDLNLLAGDGFEPVPHITSDDPFPGASMAGAGWRKKYARLVRNDTRLAHIHVRQRRQPNHRFALLFRDYLRATPDVRDLYSRFKVTCGTLAREASDPGGSGQYLDLKDPCVKLIAHSAEMWADITGWSVQD